MQFLQVEERAAGLHPRLCGGDWAAPLRDQAAGGEGRHQWRWHESQRYHFGSVADPGYLSRIPDPNFSIPDPFFFQPGSRIRIKDFKYFNPKKWFLSTQKYDPGCSSRILILLFTHPGSRGQKGTGSRIRIRNTASRTLLQIRISTYQEIEQRNCQKSIEIFCRVPTFYS